MKKRMIAALTASFALLALASAAGAAITISQAPGGPGYQNLSPWNCTGHQYYLTPRYDASGAWIPNTGNPIRLVFGWAAKNAAEMTQFFQHSHGSVSITGDDTFSDAWTDNPAGTPFVSQAGIAWSPLESIMATTPGGGTQVAAVASNYRGVLSLAPGMYTLSVTFVFDSPIQDGFQIYKGTMNGTCTFAVNP